LATFFYPSEQSRSEIHAQTARRKYHSAPKFVLYVMLILKKLKKNRKLPEKNAY
jgi:hypothetical protein